ncbi:MAG TPA: hypothetical protein VLT33_12595, partial [Labilithrix sp.]|nr:hypothetical protein [Labilithrix sp.]
MLLALLAPGCTRHPLPEPASDAHDSSPPPPDASADAANAADAAREALTGPAELVELLDGKERLGFVSVPLGAREPRPIMVAIHGGSDKPERAC